MKYYEILPTHTETPRNTTRKITNLYIEFNYDFLTLQKKIPLLLNRSVHSCSKVMGFLPNTKKSDTYTFCIDLKNHKHKYEMFCDINTRFYQIS